MFITPLETERQVIVGNSVERALAADRATPLTSGARARGDAVIASTLAVSLFAGLRPVHVDRATDKVVIGFEHMLIHAGAVLHDAVLPQSEAQQLVAARIRQVRARLFSGGTEFTRGSMDAQWSGLVALRSRMQEPEVAAAIDALGMRPFADHVLAHVELYGRILGQQGGKARAGEEQANAAWNEAFRVFAAQVLVDYHKDAAIQDELLGAYHAQLAQQRALARAAKRRPAPAPADPPAPPAEGQADPPAPTADEQAGDAPAVG
jgi:hypothetical protein